MNRPRSRSRLSLGFFAFTAASAFVLVSVVDPYSGATASPYFQPVGASFADQETQTVQVAGSYTNVVARDSFSVAEKPKPKPKPKPQPKAVEAASFSAPPSAAVPNPGSAQAIAHDKVMARGWGEDQFSCLVSLWEKESGWRVNAENPSSGAYGIPQSLPGSKMGSAGADWATNPATQIEWGLGYITDRYGSPCGAWAKSQADGWY